MFLDHDRVIEKGLKMFYWASLSQIKERALMDKVLNPFVKTIQLCCGFNRSRLRI
jgi:hypothetical protein